jgi:signal transduction histidine kinase/CheY-like chemotaxis protein
MDGTADAQDRAALDRHRLEAMAAQAQRLSLALPASALFIAAIVWPAASLWQLALWVAAIPLTRAARVRALRRLAASADANVMARTLPSSMVSGLVHSAPVWLWMGQLSVERKALLTMMLVSYSTTSISTNAHYLPGYLVYSALLLVPLIVGWSWHALAAFGATPGAADVALETMLPALIAAFLFVQYGFARQAERTFVESFWIRYEKDRLLADLRREREALAAARDRAEAANRAKSRFLAAASHDLRQPMHSLALFAEALQLQPLQDSARSIVRHMSEAVRALAFELDQLLDVSKLDAGIVKVGREPFALQPLLQRLTDQTAGAAQRKGVAVELRCDPGLAVVSDAAQLERIVRNLLDNAVKYTDRGAIRVDAERRGELVTLVVADTGRGIPAAEHERIFEEFYQIDNPERDRRHGLGLGLAIVRRLAALLGTEVTVESEPGAGARFALTLQAHAPLPTEPAAQTAPSPVSLHVLVIDDEASVRSAMRALLEALGCRVTTAAGVAEGVAALAQGPPDIVLADLRLRGEETGIDAIAALRDRLPALPAILISADTDPQRLRQADTAGLPLLHKPVSSAQLQQAMTTALGASAAP